MKTNIILANLPESKLRKVLELCKEENIRYTFDSAYYQSNSYHFVAIIEHLLLNSPTPNPTIPLVYKKLIEEEYLPFIEDADDEYKNRDILLEKLEHIEYV